MGGFGWVSLGLWLCDSNRQQSTISVTAVESFLATRLGSVVSS